MFYGAHCASIVKLSFPSMTKMLNIPSDTAYIRMPAEKQHIWIFICVLCFTYHIFSPISKSVIDVWRLGCACLKDILGGYKLWGTLLADLITLSVHVETTVCLHF